MNKYSTYLMPFMTHLLTQLAKKSMDRSISFEYNMIKSKGTAEVSRLDERKRTLLEETKNLLSLAPAERELFF